jgi:hypothetical protein
MAVCWPRSGHLRERQRQLTAIAQWRGLLIDPDQAPLEEAGSEEAADRSRCHYIDSADADDAASSSPCRATLRYAIALLVTRHNAVASELPGREHQEISFTLGAEGIHVTNFAAQIESMGFGVEGCDGCPVERHINSRPQNDCATGRE